jgi:hypothetical protein
LLHTPSCNSTRQIIKHTQPSPDRGARSDSKHCTGNPFDEALFALDLRWIPKNDEYVVWETSDERLVNGLIAPAGYNAGINRSTHF